MSALNPGFTGPSEFDPLSILQPIVRNREARLTGTRIKVVELNAFGGRRFEEIVALLSKPPLQNPDIVLLCEMDWQMPRTSNLEIPDEIAKRLGMTMAYGPEFAFRRKEVEFRSFFGNAILSSAPLEDVSIVPVPVLFDWSAKFMRQGFGSLVRIGARAGLMARAKMGGREIVIGVLHTESRTGPAGRESQMAAMMRAFPATGAAILGGDFNATTITGSGPIALAGLAAKFVVEPLRLRNPERHEPLFQRIRDHGFEISGANVPLQPTFTFSRFLPRFIRPKLDWICYREVRPVAGSAAVVDAANAQGFRVSDHDLVSCEFDLA